MDKGNCQSNCIVTASKRQEKALRHWKVGWSGVDARKTEQELWLNCFGWGGDEQASEQGNMTQFYEDGRTDLLFVRHLCWFVMGLTGSSGWGFEAGQFWGRVLVSYVVDVAAGVLDVLADQDVYIYIGIGDRGEMVTYLTSASTSKIILGSKEGGDEVRDAEDVQTGQA